MNKKGFTLIELLAVIVILAIIALIATPLVMSTIKKARDGATKASLTKYIEAVEQTVMESNLTATPIKTGIVYEVKDIEVNLKNNNVTKGYYLIDTSGKVDYLTVCINNKVLTYKEEKIEITDQSCNDFEGKINPNLLTNTMLKNNTNGWPLSAGMALDQTENFNGCNVIKSIQIGNSPSTYRVASQLFPGVVGNNYTFSVYVKYKYETLDSFIYLQIFENSASKPFGSVQSATYIYRDILNKSKWVKYSITRKLIENDNIDVRVSMGTAQNGEVWFACPKLEIGDVATPYVPNINEI